MFDTKIVPENPVYLWLADSIINLIYCLVALLPNTSIYLISIAFAYKSVHLWHILWKFFLPLLQKKKKV